MRNFTILFSDLDGAEPRRVEFMAEDPARALSIVEREHGSKPIEIWEGSKRLGTLTRSGGDLWRIS